MIRKPSDDEETDKVDLTDEPLDLGVTPAPGSLETTVKEEPSKVEPSNSFSDEDKKAIARGITGATPALLGMLFGASPLTAVDQIKQGQEYYANGTPKKLVMTKGENGEPIYTDSRDAVGKEAYQKPVRPSSASAGLVVTDLVSKDGKNVTKALINKSANTMVEVGTGKTLDPNEWHPPVQTNQLVEATQLGGAKTITPVNKFTTTAPVALNGGIGDKYNMPAQEVELGNKYAQKTAAEMRPYIEARSNINGALRLLQQDPNNDNAIVQAAGIFRTAKMVVNERISDDERQFVTQAPGVLDNLANQIATGVSGAQRDQILSQMREILIHLDKVQADSAKSVQDINVQAYSGGEPSKAKYLSDRIVNSISPSAPPINPAPLIKNSQPGIVATPLPRPVPSVIPKYTKQQLDAMTPQQRQRIFDDITASRRNK